MAGRQGAGVKPRRQANVDASSCQQWAGMRRPLWPAAGRQAGSPPEWHEAQCGRAAVHKESLCQAHR